MTRERLPLADNMDQEKVAKAYAKMASLSTAPYRFWARRALGRVLLKEGTALDVGCGPGYLLIEMARIAPRFGLYGLDNSAAMLKIAQENVAKASLTERIKLVEGSAFRMPFKDNFFDVVICTNTLHGIDDLRAFFTEAHRVLKVGGDIRVHAWRRDAWPILIKLVSWQQKRYDNSLLDGPKPVFDASYTSSEVAAVLRNIPFQTVSLRAPMAVLTLTARK